MDTVEIPEYICRAGSCLYIGGPSTSGKTTLLAQIIKERNHFYSEECKKVVICFKEYQPLYDKIRENDDDISFFYGMPTESDLDHFIKNANNNYSLLVLDDLIAQVPDSSLVNDILVHISHHKKLNLIQISQNIFEQGKHARTQSLNYSGFLLLRTLRDLRQISYLGTQVFPGKNRAKAFMACYQDAMDNPLSTFSPPHLFVNTAPYADRAFQLQSNLFPLQNTKGRVIYRI